MLNFETGSVILGSIVIFIGFIYSIYVFVRKGETDEGIMFLGFMILVPYINIIMLLGSALMYLTHKEELVRLTENKNIKNKEIENSKK